MTECICRSIVSYSQPPDGHKPGCPCPPETPVEAGAPWLVGQIPMPQPKSGLMSYWYDWEDIDLRPPPATQLRIMRQALKGDDDPTRYVRIDKEQVELEGVADE